MPCKPPQARLLRLIGLSMTLAVAGCAATPHMPLILAALDCSSVIPPSYRRPVQATPLPPADATAGGLWSALDDQTSRLDRANGRTGDVIAMADSCQAHQSKVMAALSPRRAWWRIW